MSPASSIVRLAITSALLCASSLAAAASAHADQLLVGFDRGQVSSGERADAIDDAGARSPDLVVSAPTLAVDTATIDPGASLARTRERLEKDPRVAWVAGDRVLHLDAAQAQDPCWWQPWGFKPSSFNDPDGCREWWMRPGDDATAGIMDAWPRIAAAPSVIVGVVDDGIELSHPDLAGQLWTNPQDGAHGFNVVTGSEDPSVVDDGHGTNVAGVIAAAANNGIGIAGACPNCRILPVVAFSPAKGGALDSDVIAGIAAAAGHGAQVVNLSLSGADPDGRSTAMYVAVFKQYPDVTFVLSAGNEGQSNDVHPRSPCNAAKLAANAICVGATDANDGLVQSSDWGSAVALAAPGDDIYTTGPGHGYVLQSGTSFSAPLVAAAAAVLRSLGASARQSVTAIVDGADAPASLTRKHIRQRLNVTGALQELDAMEPDTDPPPVTPAPTPTPTVTPAPRHTTEPAPQPAESPAPRKPSADPLRDPALLSVRTPRWSRHRLRLPIRCRAACTLTVRAYTGRHRVLLAAVKLKKAAGATLTSRLARSSFRRIKRLRVTVTGQYAVKTVSRRPARLK